MTGQLTTGPPPPPLQVASCGAQDFSGVLSTVTLDGMGLFLEVDDDDGWLAGGWLAGGSIVGGGCCPLPSSSPSPCCGRGRVRLVVNGDDSGVSPRVLGSGSSAGAGSDVAVVVGTTTTVVVVTTAGGRNAGDRLGAVRCTFGGAVVSSEFRHFFLELLRKRPG